MIKPFIVFAIINSAALWLGNFLTTGAISADWYVGLNKAPWTPPGWVFGLAWILIMICFSFFMAILWEKVERKKLLVILFGSQWILNVGWNLIFFHFQAILFGLIAISALTFVVGTMLIKYSRKLKYQVVLIVPYIIWLSIATSLNAYIFLYN